MKKLISLTFVFLSLLLLIAVFYSHRESEVESIEVIQSKEILAINTNLPDHYKIDQEDMELMKNELSTDEFVELALFKKVTIDRIKE